MTHDYHSGQETQTELPLIPVNMILKNIIIFFLEEIQLLKTYNSTHIHLFLPLS
jgi:hypothetical protein